jgi:hypothetical protein
MSVSQPLLSSLAVVAGVVAMFVDGRNAVASALAVVGLGLAPSAASVGGGPALIVLVAAGVGGALVEVITRSLARRAPLVVGLDPSVPIFASGRELFGPRSVRILAAALALPAASWVSFNAPVGAVAVVQGLLLPAAYIWICGALRLVVARNLADVVVGIALVGFGGGVSWLIRGGPDAFGGLVVACSLAPAASLVSGWLAGRHARRPSKAEIGAA